MVSMQFSFQQQQAKQQALLLSSKDGWTLGESIFTHFINPAFSLLFQNGTATLESRARKRKLEGDSLSILENFLAQGYTAVGYLSYEFFRFIERDFAPDPRKGGAQLPDACFMFFEDGPVRGKIDEWMEFRGGIGSGKALVPRPNMTKSNYMRMVDRARAYIAEGDIYQVNLSQRFEVPFEVPPLHFFTKLYKAQPVPFACCLDFGEFQLVSGSMELFLRRTGRRLVTRPIKGTRARGMDEREDEALRAELVESEKERAENLMIVDLMRNDLGRVCEFGSVRVNRLFEVEPYTTLYQMVSEVEGKLRDGVTTGDIVRATFPPGSVTGAPKRRAMEIIDELEPHLRGPYCGAIGFFEPSGDFTLSVAIRVLTASRGKGTFWVGGGIMWDSVPEREYDETLIKAQAIMKAFT
jgi:aminodeoxychorismate synthase component I